MKPQLTLRDLFWLVLVCALAVGWGVSSYRTDDLAVVRSMLETLETRPEIPSIGGGITTRSGQIILVDLTRAEP